MIPNELSMFMAALLGSVSGTVGVSRAPSREKVLLMRLDRAEAAQTAKLAAPSYHAALAKRERKRLKRLTTTSS